MVGPVAPPGEPGGSRLASNSGHFLALPERGPPSSSAISGTATLEWHHPDEPAHWYLEALGERSAHQGQGIGTRLLEPVLATCDADRLPAYLDTATERNLVFYQRLGFQVHEEFDLGNGPHIWTMWREPLAGT
jgi:GNAT superfamily N-acetyltransferase